MRRVALLLIALTVSGAAAAATGIKELHDAGVDLGDEASLQRGARTFVNYCVSCHSARYARYSRLAADLGIPEDIVAAKMMFAADKIGSTMNVALRAGDGETWFGVPPPDLSVIARSRGPDWLYTFLLTFYLDPARPTGVNNLVYRDTAMPHVLWELQGLQRAVPGADADTHGGSAGHPATLELASRGLQNEQEYRRTVRDLVNFLVYLGEPAKLARYRIGFWVILFLIGFCLLAWRLKKEYWKDVH